MTNRKLGYIVRNQSPVLVDSRETVQAASKKMWDACAGSVLVVDEKRTLVGIFTGRDAVRCLANNLEATKTPVSEVMTKQPVTISADRRAIDALRLMADGGFRHVPVVENGQIWGIVSRGDFKGAEIEHMDHEQHLWETIR